jgi:DNA primase
LIGRQDLANEIVKEQELISSVSFAKEISPVVVEQLHRNLLMDASKLQYLLRQRRLSYFVIKKFLIGYDPASDRYSIPIKSRTGKFLNIKLHNSTKEPKSLSWVSGAGKPRLFPYSSLLKTSVVICEGEFDCLVLHSLQINGITSTAGADSWQESWNELFQDKYVKIVMDLDQAGFDGAEKIAFNLNGIAKSIQIINLPSVKQGKTDITDAVRAGVDLHKVLMEKKR